MDPQAEKAVLGAIILDNVCAAKAFSVLKSEDFFFDQNKKIFRAMQALVGEGTPIDLVPLSDFIKNSGDLGAVGGVAYLSSLGDGMPKVSRIEHYASIVKEKSILRSLITLSDDIQKKAFNNGNNKPVSIVEEAISKFLGLASTTSGPLVRDWVGVSQSAIRKIRDDREFPEKAAVMNIGLEDIDQSTGGFRKKEVVVIVGPTSNGKTLLAAQFADNAEKQGYRGTIFSAEMPGEQIVLRQIAYDAHVPFWKTRFPERLSDEEFERLSEASQIQRKLMIVEKDIRPANIWALAEAQKRSWGLDFVVVDYDQLVIEAGIDPDEDEENFFRHQRAFVLEGKRIAESLDICLILLSQLRKVSTKVAQGGRPAVDDIYGDSAIRNTPDVIIWVVRQYFQHGFKKEFEDKATAFIVKARNGRVARVDLKFDSEFVRLLDMPPSEKDSTPEATTKSSSFRIED